MCDLFNIIGFEVDNFYLALLIIGDSNCAVVDHDELVFIFALVNCESEELFSIIVDLKNHGYVELLQKYNDRAVDCCTDENYSL